MTSLFELFKIGIGPSSSHTVGPMRAALSFAQGLSTSQALPTVARIQVDLYGSLALTGKGHGTDTAVIAGLCGQAPDTVDAESFQATLSEAAAGTLRLHGTQGIRVQSEHDVLLHTDQMYPPPGTATHPNGVRFSAFDSIGNCVATETYYSIGGGFIVTAEHFASGTAQRAVSLRQRKGVTRARYNEQLVHRRTAPSQ